MVLAGNYVYFAAQNGSGRARTAPLGVGRELFRTLGTANSTTLVKDILPGPEGSEPEGMHAIGATVYFRANDGINGTELWKSDGTTAGTQLVMDINTTSATASSYPRQLTQLGDTVVFHADDGIHGGELWRSDGTPAGTVMLRDIWSGPRGSDLDNLLTVGNLVFFSAKTMAEGEELWLTDGTQAGTVILKDIKPGTNTSGYGLSSRPGYFTAHAGNLFFVANDGDANHGRELWKSDGTTLGTVMVEDINPGTVGSTVERIISTGSRYMFFSADDGVLGLELWRSDGTPSGTNLVVDLNTGPADFQPYDFMVSGGKLLFTADDGVTGRELHVIDPGANSKMVGVGCRAAGVAPVLTCTDPVMGTKMSLSVKAPLSNAPGALIIGLPATPTAIGFGCILYFDLTFPTVSIGVQTSATGEWTLPNLNLPNNPNILGLNLAGQAIVGLTPTMPFGTDLTNGVLFTVRR